LRWFKSAFQNSTQGHLDQATMTTGGTHLTILDWARKVQAIAQSGLAFTKDPFDRERYQQLQDLVASILSTELQVPVSQARAFWDHEKGYATPKVDVRGGVFRDGKVLLVRERSDGKWTLPGGWVDVNDAPSSAVAREIREESGYLARAVKLVALFDKNAPRHGHPPGIHHIYKLFFLCELTGGEPTLSIETDGVDFYAPDSLPELSTGRVTRSQIARLYEHHLHRDLPTDFD
jgi:ADP-ribose pyrophosphatase YjhB (NUDIX family)